MKNENEASRQRAWFKYLRDHYGRAVDHVRRLDCFAGTAPERVVGLLSDGDDEAHRTLASALRADDQRTLGAALSMIVVLFFEASAGRRAARRHAALGDELEDALVVAQARLVGDLERYDPERGTLIAWYARLFERCCLDLRRKRARRRDEPGRRTDELESGAGAASDERSEAREIESGLRRAVARVARRKPRSQRRLLIFVQPFLWGRDPLPRGTARVFGRRCGLTEGSVRTSLCRLRKDVQSELQRSSCLRGTIAELVA